MVVDDLRPHPKGNEGGTRHQQHPSPPCGDGAAQQPQQNGHGQGEQQGKYHSREAQAPEAVQLHKQLFIIDHRQEKQRRSGQPFPKRLWKAAGGSPFLEFGYDHSKLLSPTIGRLILPDFQSAVNKGPLRSTTFRYAPSSPPFLPSSYGWKAPFSSLPGLCFPLSFL